MEGPFRSNQARRFRRQDGRCNEHRIRVRRRRMRLLDPSDVPVLHAGIARRHEYGLGPPLREPRSMTQAESPDGSRRQPDLPQVRRDLDQSSEILVSAQVPDPRVRKTAYAAQSDRARRCVAISQRAASATLPRAEGVPSSSPHEYRHRGPRRRLCSDQSRRGRSRNNSCLHPMRFPLARLPTPRQSPPHPSTVGERSGQGPCRNSRRRRAREWIRWSCQ